MISDKILNFFVKQGRFSEESAQEILKQAEKQGLSVEEYLLSNSLVSEDEITNLKSQLFNVPVADIYNLTIPLSILKIIPQQVAENYNLVAFDKKDNLLKVALSDPANFKAREAVTFLAKDKGLEVEFYVAPKSAIDKLLVQYKGLRATVKEAVSEAEARFAKQIKQAEEVVGEGLEKVVELTPIARLVNSFLTDAVEHRASDVHIEPLIDKKTRIRYRIDGILREISDIPLHLHSAIVARIKVMANLKLDETRIPQDGRARIEVKGRKVDLRISTLPLLDNEKVVIRILDPSQRIFNLEDLGFWGKGLDSLREELKKPHGLFLVTGPTGSGKTTTLYAILKILNKIGVNIVSLEDPIEYYIEGINQSQIKPHLGYTFATGLRSVVRQDPDVIMVGEIRDSETAELAIHAALTGHIVLSTLHTNDAIGAVPRLIDMGVEPFLLSSCLNFVIAQRLVRKICPKCKEKYVVDKSIAEHIENSLKGIKGFNLNDYKDKKTGNFYLYRGKGCSYCNQQGYVGRLAIFEVLRGTDNLREIITSKLGLEEIEKEAFNQGMKTMLQDGFIKALKGLTTLEEVLRVTKE